jgi:hypothetical protein
MEANRAPDEADDSSDQAREQVGGDGPDALTTADLASAKRTDAQTSELEDQDTDHPEDQDRTEPLLPREDLDVFRNRWEQIQVGFVDEPRKSVEEADQLVAELMQSLAGAFSKARSDLETQWSGGRDASTEDLRVALRRYRTFFERLLAA